MSKRADWMRRVVCSAGVALLVLAPGVSRAVDVQALTQETQKMSQSPDEITMVWWLPEEFWSASLAQAPGMTADQKEEFLKTVRPYTMIVVVDGKMGSFGGVTYKSEDSIRAGTRLVDAQGKSYAPKTAGEVDADTKNMLQMMKPIFVNLLGPMGENMHFLLFPGKTDAGAAIADATGKGSFKVKLGASEFKWRLPLDSLLPVQVCASCKSDCKGSWGFCPWCGTRLGRVEAVPKPVAAVPLGIPMRTLK